MKSPQAKEATMEVLRETLRLVWQEYGQATQPEMPGYEIYSDERFQRLFFHFLDAQTMAKLAEKDDADVYVQVPDELASALCVWVNNIRYVNGRKLAGVVLKSEISPGKFVLIIRANGSHVLVTGRYKDFHRKIANEYCLYFGTTGPGQRVEEKMWVEGGGDFQMWVSQKKIIFSGKSGEFGSFDHAIVEKLARQAMADEGYEDWELEVIPELPQLPIL